MAQTLLAKYSTYEEENLGTGDYTANSTGTQASGTPITTKHANIATCAGAGYSITLGLAALPGAEYFIENNAANSANLYPKNGGSDQFEAEADNTAFAIAVGEYWHFKCVKSGIWRVK